MMDNIVREQTAVKLPMSDTLFQLLFGPLPTDEQPGHWGILSRETVAAMGYEDDPRINIKVDTARMEIFVEQLAERVALEELTPQGAKAEMDKFVEQMEQSGALK